MTTMALDDDVSTLVALAHRLCGNHADADDLVQETLERALREKARYVEQGTRKGWLATILRNRFRDRCREHRRRAVHRTAIEEVAMPEREEPQAWERVTEDEVTAALAQLDVGFRRVYELHAAGLSYAQIAERLELSVNTVGTRLLRARAKLKQMLLPA